jgi:23S rRNA A2030 N6-methylase RlmJ
MDTKQINFYEPEVIEIQSANELPLRVAFVLYEPPFQDSNELREVVSEFTRKYGYEPQTIYHLGKKWYVKKEVENGTNDNKR